MLRFGVLLLRFLWCSVRSHYDISNSKRSSEKFSDDLCFTEKLLTINTVVYLNQPLTRSNPPKLMQALATACAFGLAR